MGNLMVMKAMDEQRSPMTNATCVSLWCLIGLPGSGKSTWAEQFGASTPPLQLIATDQIRAVLFGDEATQGPWRLVWEQVTDQLAQSAQQTQQGLLAGAIYDATNTRRRGRRQVVATARSLGFNRVLALWFDRPLALCLARNQQRSRQVPPAVIATMARQLAGSPPHCDEGFDAVFRL